MSNTLITKDDLREIYNLSITNSKLDIYIDLLNTYMNKYKINNRYRVSAFLAQIGHESARLQYTEEIASGVKYEGRLDLGNTISGYGVKYKGRGLIQITGYSNYKLISNAIGYDFVNEPQMLATPLFATESACLWWKYKGLNELADSGEFKEITKIINGGYNGLEDREQLYHRALEVLKPELWNLRIKKWIKKLL